MKVVLTFLSGAFDLRGTVMGRQAAGFGFLRALAQSRWNEVGCYTASEDLFQIFARDLGELSRDPPVAHFVPTGQPEALAAFDLLYRADPNLGDDAWLRQQRSGARAYSLCGVTHTLCSKAVMAAISALPDLPLYPWDAIICTSRVARDVALRLIETRIDHLRHRMGVAAFTLPQLPLIPLGVHTGDFDVTDESRAAARTALGLGPNEVAVLFAGRLTFHAKAHPIAMFLGLERATTSSRVPVRLLLFGQFPNEAIEAAFREEATRFAPSVRLTVINGALAENASRAWAGADIFTSLSDNIQETFGLTPVEAMAAGLPCVVSDWDGYKDTVRAGVDGFRVPVVTPPPGCGNDLADRYDLGLADYDRFIGETSLFTAIDIEAAAEAYRRLIVEPDLRRAMGEAGRKRAREVFDWTVVFRRYMALWEELNERRRSDPTVPGEERRTRRFDRPDPFDVFQTYPTAALGAKTQLRLYTGATAAEAIARKSLQSVGYATAVLPSDPVIVRLFDAMAACPQGLTVDELAASTSLPLGGVTRTVAFLAKMGIVKLLPTS